MQQIKIPENITVQLEKLHYEVSARQNLLTYLMNTTQFNKDLFNKYHEEYVNLNKAYEKLKNNVSKEYILPTFPDTRVQWQLDFDTSIITISK